MVCDRPSNDELEDDLLDNLDAFLGWGGCAALCRDGSMVDVELVEEAAHDGKTGSAAAILLRPDLIVSSGCFFSTVPHSLIHSGDDTVELLTDRTPNHSPLMPEHDPSRTPPRRGRSQSQRH